MGHEDFGHYAQKHTDKSKPDDFLLNAVEEASRDQMISCHSAHMIAQNYNVNPEKVGHAIDFLEIKISKCQLGLFGFGKGKKMIKSIDSVELNIKEQIHKHIVENKLTCKSVWIIADESGKKRIEIANACESLNIKISQCQLGAF
ncbi:MAG TPA: hypothetical protein PK859_13090 [Spirochaetota bacterium]|nr:hypothetical protein [Spirochaetota bacterium]HPR49777.1 hypothetical protein [Spirochaetota bacterium]